MNAHNLLVSILVFLSLLLGACAPATTATPLSSDAAPLPTPLEITLEPIALPTQTTYLTKSFKIPMSISFSADWNVVDDSLSIWSIEYKKMSGVALGVNIISDAQIADPNGNKIPFPDDFLAWMLANTDFEGVKSTSVFVAGIEGIQVDVKPALNTGKKPFLFLKTSTWNLLRSDGEWRFILIDNVSGEKVLINIIAPDGQPLSALPPEVQEILNSIVFLP